MAARQSATGDTRTRLESEQAVLQTAVASKPPSADQVSPNKSTTPSPSPHPSRDSSPSRILKPLSTPASSSNSQQTSVNGTSTPTRATASAARLPRPISLNEASNKALKSRNGDRLDPPLAQWPVSPRLKSPASSRRNSAVSRPQSDAEASDLEATPRASRSTTTAVADQGLRSPSATQSTNNAVKIPRGYGSIAGTLETVDEGDQLTPPTDPHTGGPKRPPVVERESSQITQSSTATSRSRSQEGSKGTESESDTGRGDVRPKPMPPSLSVDAAPLSNVAAKKTTPTTSTALAKARTFTEGLASNMTVETETVPSIPQTSVNMNGTDKNASGKRDDSGSIRARPSTETIRPKKERKKNPQARHSVVSGTASTKADIFEAKVNSAADDGESDSDETFVYESNPPEPRTKQRHHSRTPSGASVRSFRGAGRGKNGLLDSHRAVKNKRSMKFASNSYATGSGDEENGDRDYGTVRQHRGRPAPLTDSHYHSSSGNWNGPGDRTPVGEESPFSAASRVRHGANRSSNNSPKNSPKASPPPYSSTPKAAWATSPVNWDQSRSASEQQPLLGSLRTQRTRPSRRPHSSNLRHMEFYHEPRRSWAKRFSSFLILLILACLLAMFGAGAIYTSMRPLYNVSLLDIQNVLASEEELMLDLNCKATNPNIVSISISNVDLYVFASSRHVGSEGYWRHHGAPEPDPDAPSKEFRTGVPFIHGPDVHIAKGVDDGTDPIDDPEGDPHTMLLGRVFDFDSALTFDPSPLRRSAINSTGEIRLAKPGNHSETGGSERWERVIQHPFQLIVRGILKYKLPLNSHPVTATISGSVTVDPTAAGAPPSKQVWRWRHFKA